MALKVGSPVPSATLRELGAEGMNTVTTDELFKGRKVAMFGVPGPFTPTCSVKHLPSYVEQAEAMKAKGVDEIVCIAVSDAFVMKAWGEDQKVADKVRLLADGNAEFTKAAGLEMDGSGFGLGLRCQRFSMIVDDGVVTTLNIEEPGAYEVSGAEKMLTQL